MLHEKGGSYYMLRIFDIFCGTISMKMNLQQGICGKYPDNT